MEWATNYEIRQITVFLCITDDSILKSFKMFSVPEFVLGKMWRDVNIHKFI